MRLSKLLVALAVTVGAFALVGANARTAAAAIDCTGTTAGTVNAGAIGTSVDACVHVNEPRTAPAAAFCMTSTADPDSPAQNCGHVLFSTTIQGTIAGAVTFNEGVNGNIITPALCQLDPATAFTTCLAIFDQTSPNCTLTSTGTGTVTNTLTCTNLPAGQYELLVVTTFVDNCDMFALDPLGNPIPCSLSGLVVTATITFTAPGGGGGAGGGAGGGGGTTTGAGRKVTGGGQIVTSSGGNAAQFSVLGFDATTKGHLRLTIKANCTIKANDLTAATVDSPTHAHLHARAEVTTAKGNTLVTDVDVDAFDNGEGSTGTADHVTYKVPAAPSCNIDGNVSGNIQIHF